MLRCWWGQNKQEEQMLKMTHIHVQPWKHCVSYVSYIHTCHTKYTVPNLFYVCKKPYKDQTMVDKNLTNCLQFLILTHLWPCHKVKVILVHSKQGHHNAKLEKPGLNSVHEKANNKVSVTSICVNVKKSCISMTCFMYLTIL